MIVSLFLPVLMQSATPFGSPVEPLLRPSNARPVRNEASRSPATRTPKDVRFDQCVDQAADDPNAGLLAANGWQLEGGGYLARNCLGFAYAELGDWAKATPEFVQAATAAEKAGDARTGNFWSQAGNAALAGGDAALALTYLRSALEHSADDALLKGEAHLDMARAFVALNRYDEARAQFGLVHELVPQDPLGWLLSATLARRTDDLAKAKADIATAAKLVSADPAIALEAGNIAYEAGDMASAKSHWEQAIKFDPDSPPAQAAARYLVLLTVAPDK